MTTRAGHRYLQETGQYDNTLIVFTCDHGEQLGTITC